MSARRASSDLFLHNYALHVGDDPERVRMNRQKLVERLGMSFSSWTCGEQVHGADIAEVTPDERGRGRDSLETALPSVDGLLTDVEDILLTSFYADCVPLLFYSPDSNLIGLAQDRKSTRLNSSHVRISYAVFCLKKKHVQPRSTA